jgi:hypothetical protein
MNNKNQLQQVEQLLGVIKSMLQDQSPSLPLLKSLDDEKRLVTGVVLEPEIIDAQGDVISIAEIEKACFDYMAKSQQVGLQHQFVGPASVVESWIAKNDCFLDKQYIKKGTWLMTVKVDESDAGDEVWELVKKGSITGFSIGGTGEVDDEEK